MRFATCIIFKTAELKKLDSSLRQRIVKIRPNVHELKLSDDTSGDGCEYPRKLSPNYGTIRLVFTDLKPNEVAINQNGQRIDHIDVICDGSNKYRSETFTICNVSHQNNAVTFSFEEGKAEFGWPSQLVVYLFRWQIHESKLDAKRDELVQMAMAAFSQAASIKSSTKQPRTPAKKKVVTEKAVGKGTMRKAGLKKPVPPKARTKKTGHKIAAMKKK